MPILESFEGLVQVENQFRMTVRNHSLRRGALAVVLQNPKAVDEGTELRRRCYLTIPNHISMIAGQMPN